MRHSKDVFASQDPSTKGAGVSLVKNLESFGKSKVVDNGKSIIVYSCHVPQMSADHKNQFDLGMFVKIMAQSKVFHSPKE